MDMDMDKWIYGYGCMWTCCEYMDMAVCEYVVIYGYGCMWVCCEYVNLAVCVYVVNIWIWIWINEYMDMAVCEHVVDIWIWLYVSMLWYMDMAVCEYVGNMARIKMFVKLSNPLIAKLFSKLLENV